jgi:hypothetical protein
MRQRPLLLRLLHRVEQVRNQQRSDDADDGNDDEKLNQREAKAGTP